jgi:adenine deaminase
VIAGRGAVDELLERSVGTGLDVLLSPFYAAALGLGEFGNPGRFTVDDLSTLVRHPGCVELREWNYSIAKAPVPGLREAWESALERRVVVGGHLEGLRGSALQASVALGARSDHETATAEEAVEKARAGVTVQIREGSGARDLDALIRAITELGADPRCFSFSTDEQELSSIVRVGHIDHKLRRAVAAGAAPIDAVRMATLNAALSLGLADEYGAVAAGRIAAIVLVEDLSSFRVVKVLSRGVPSAEDGRYLLAPARRPYPADWTRTVRIDRTLTDDSFLLDAPDGTPTLRVIGLTPGSLLTDELEEPVALEGGRLAGVPDGLAKLAVIDRHENGAAATVGLIRGLGIASGAVAATINPGLMDLMVIGVDEHDMAVAANRVIELQGGIVVAREQAVVAEVALPLLGIFAQESAAETADRCLAVERAIADELGSPVEGLLTSAGFACLAVSIPRLKVCARGLVRVDRSGQEKVGLVVEEPER